MKPTTIASLLAGALGAEIVWLQRDLPPPEEATFVEFEGQIAEINFSSLTSKDSYGVHSKKHKNDWRPYNGVHQSGIFTWTAIDGKQPEIMKFLAKDPAMFKRLCEQNRYVTRRQLIYVNDDFHKISSEIYSGSRKEVSLPGFDGEELAVIVDNVDLNISDNISAWDGHLANEPDSTVQASSDGAELLHIEVHLKGRQVRYEARESDEWIIQEIDLKALNESNQLHTAQVIKEEILPRNPYRVLATR